MNVAILDGYLYSGRGRHGVFLESEPLFADRGVRDVWTDTATVTALAGEQKGRIWSGRGRTVAEYANTSGRVFLHDYASDTWQQMHIDQRNAAESLRRLDRFAALLNVKTLQHSPGYRGISTLAKQRLHHAERFEYEPFTERCDTIIPNVCKAVQYRDTQGGQYLHAYDLRAAWLSAARTTPCGYGALRFVTKWDDRLTGYWVATLKSDVPVTSPIRHSGIYPTAIVRAAKMRGANIVVESGWIYEYQADSLRWWCEWLGKARQAGMSVSDPLDVMYNETMIKLIYTRTFGTLDRKSRERAWQYQPHWYDALKAESARRCWQIFDLNPSAIALDVDTIYLLTNERNPVAALTVPGNRIASANATAIGSWRYKGSCVPDKSLVDATGGKGSDLSLYLRQRNALQDWSTAYELS